MADTIGFISPEAIAELATKKENLTYGFCVLFDIIGSTEIKLEYSESWRKRFIIVYDSFRKLFDAIGKELKTLEADFDISDCVLKYIGDGLLAYFPIEKSCGQCSQSSTPKVKHAHCIMDNVLTFLREINSKTDTLGIKLKTVVTYLTDIELVGELDGFKQRDALGRGIDFSFRLEKFADATHIVTNKLMETHLLMSVGAEQNWITRNGCLSVPCERFLKGWTTPQGFSLLVKKEWILDVYPYKTTNANYEHVFLELFQTFIKLNEPESAAGGDELASYR
jgi:hypothetical protein